MESYSKEFIGFYNEGVGHTPFLDSLMQYSIVFENAYANGLKSIEALPAITASIPALMKNPFITSNQAQNKFTSIASILNDEGYTSSFYHGGMRGTMGFYSFSKKADFNHYFGMEEFNNNEFFDGSWGIYDKDFMNFFGENLNNTKEPFFSTFFSLSSHPPYILPKSYMKKNNLKKNKISMKETISYTDHAMKHFFNISKDQEWFKNTIFIITADHTAGETFKEEYKNKTGRYAIPLIIFHGDSSRYERNKNIVQQIDIMPTILEIVNYNKPFFSFGKSMFSEKNWAISFLQNKYRFITNNGIIINQEEKYNSFSDWEELERNNPNIYDVKLLKAIKQDFNYRMTNNNLEYEN